MGLASFSAAEGFSRNIWIAEVDRPVKTPVTFTRGDSAVGFYDYPAWSPAGDRMAYFTFVPPQQYSIRSKAADGRRAEMELVKDVELDIRAAGSQPGAAYQVSVYRGQVETLSAAQAVDRRVEEWRQQVENESGGPVARRDRPAGNNVATPPSDQRGSLSYEVYLPAGGEYLVVAVAEGGQDVDVVVGANLLEGYVQLAQDQLVSPLAAGWFELGDGDRSRSA